MFEWMKVIVGSVAVALFAFWALQERMIFMRQPASPPPAAAGVSIEKIVLAARDGTRLAGWLGRQSQGAAPLVVYFGGNAEEVSWMSAAAGQFPGWSVLAVNYRGYGESGGKPGEEALFADALTIYDFAASRADVDRSRIVAMGRSLGSGVATYLAANRPVAGVMLITPFDSLAEVGARAYPFLPVRWLLRHRFDSISLAPSIRVPALMIAADRDSIIPPEHGMRLREAWGGPVTWVGVPDAGHNDLDADPRFWTSMAEFLRDKVPGAPGRP